MVKIEEIANKLADDMPDVQEHVIEMENENIKKEEEIQSKYSDKTDRDGRAFDPNLHETIDGAPVFNKDGSIRMKRGVGSPKSRLAEPRQGRSEGPLSAPGSTPTDAGRQIAEAIFALGQALGGEEWKPIVNKEYGIDERSQMHSAWANYCESTGLEDLPPGVVVLIAMGGYVVPRLTMPKTKSRLQRAKEWTIRQYINWRYGDKTDAARSDSGDNRKRKDDAG